jgi:hypothetical protein
MESNLLSKLADLGQSELRITLAVCAVSLLAVWWPLTRGALLCWRARVATRIPSGNAGSEQVAGGRLASLIGEVASSAESEVESAAAGPFMRDAAKQLVVDDYESSFAQPISMYANILPPIGFIGTTCGLAVLLLSMHLSRDGLQLGALALALSSTIFALVGYAILESLKIHLYGRLARSIDAGLRGIA